MLTLARGDIVGYTSVYSFDGTSLHESFDYIEEIPEDVRCTALHFVCEGLMILLVHR